MLTHIENDAPAGFSFWRFYQPTAAPTVGGDFYVECFCITNKDWIRLTAYDLSTNLIWTRIRVNNVWNEWKRIDIEQINPSPNEVRTSSNEPNATMIYFNNQGRHEGHFRMNITNNTFVDLMITENEFLFGKTENGVLTKAKVVASFDS